MSRTGPRGLRPILTLGGGLLFFFSREITSVEDVHEGV
jgi:hypothetical protein